MPRAAKPYTLENPTSPVKKMPATETGRKVHYTAAPGREYWISHNCERMRFTLWRVVAGGYEKMATSDNPYHLYPLADNDEHKKKKTT